MMLNAVPARNCVIEITADLSGSTLRATIDCSALTICDPIKTLSIALCGPAPAWPPLPWTVIWMLSDEASIAPGVVAKWPSGRPGMLCMP